MGKLAPIAVAVCFGLLTYGSVQVFIAIDRSSHSASDTLRPFLMTMAPIWAVAVAAAIAVLRRSDA